MANEDGGAKSSAGEQGQGDAARGPTEDQSTPGVTAPARDTVDLLLERLMAQQSAAPPARDIWYFLSSGVFFMLVGALTLIFAFITMGTTHASFTFILVVVGVAILLYGTGTQGAGNFETSAGEMKYKIGVAGGAGVLAFAVALGIVMKSNDIRDAFQVERKYARLIFRDPGDGVGSMANYIAEVSVDGVPVPSYRSGDFIVAYLPFVAGLSDREVEISANFFHVSESASANRLELQRVPFRKSFPLKLGEITTDDAGFDFPRLRPDLVVKLSTDEVVNDVDASQISAMGRAPPSAGDAPPPVIQAFQ